MRFFPTKAGPKHRPSLSRRLIGVVLAAVGTGMIVSAGVSVWQQSVRYAEDRREVLLATAGVFSSAVASAAGNRDAAGAFTAIRAIGNMPNILFAHVEAADGSTLASIGSAPTLLGDYSADRGHSAFDLFWSRTAQVSVPIVYAGQPAGRLVLIGGTEGLIARLIVSVAVTALGGLMALIVGLLVAWRFQRRVTRPLQQLMGAIARIREHHKYDVSLVEAGDHEIGMVIDGFNAMVSDIQERDARLDAHRRNLEQEVADRTRDLREARDSAEAANRAKSDFLATMSHEIRTPMNGIIVMAELLVQAEAAGRQRRYAEVIANSGQSLLAIINDILDFSKIESGKLELERVAFDLVERADNVVSLFAERARSKTIDLAALVDPATPRMILGDPVRLTQVITNLVNNALKFTSSGFVQLLISPTPGRPGMLSIAVEDSGIGIPPEKLGTIFEAFSQADESTTRQFGGTGLGLTICKKLVTAMDGHIEVTSTPGSGSTFTITIPAEAAGEPQPWPRLKQSKDMAFCIVDLQGEATVAAASRYFSAAGYAVMPADARLGDTGHAGASLICVDADRLGAFQLGPRSGRKPIIIAVASFGDAAADQLIEDGTADAVLSRPLMRSDAEDLLARIVSGPPLLAARDAGKQSAAPRFAGLKVLVADDNAVNREVAIEALSRMGAVVGTVENGAQAIAAVRDGSFDLVLMDGSMPEVDGFTAAREVRAIESNEARKPVPIVALTAHVVGTSADAWRDAGMNDVLYKPYTLAQLAACFHRLFPDWRAQKPSTAADVPAADAVESNASDAGRSELLDPRIARELEEIAGPASRQFLQRIFGLYLDNAPRGRDEMVRAFQAADRDNCARAAHALKSMSHNVGAVKVAAAAEHIERWCREKDGMPEAQTIADFVALLDATLAEVAARVDAPTASRDRLSA